MAHSGIRGAALEQVRPLLILSEGSSVRQTMTLLARLPTGNPPSCQSWMPPS